MPWRSWKINCNKHVVMHFFEACSRGYNPILPNDEAEIIELYRLNYRRWWHGIQPHKAEPLPALTQWLNMKLDTDVYQQWLDKSAHSPSLAVSAISAMCMYIFTGCLSEGPIASDYANYHHHYNRRVIKNNGGCHKTDKLPTPQHPIQGLSIVW